MAICKNCGKEIDENVKFCPECGVQTGDGTDTNQETKQKNSEQKNSDFSSKFAEINNTPDTTADYDAQDIENNKVMGILAYLSWLVLIPLLAAKNSAFARFHCNQGIVLAIAEIAITVVCNILGLIPIIGWLFIVIESIVGLACFILSVIGIINAANGKAKELPFIGKFKILK